MATSAFHVRSQSLPSPLRTILAAGLTAGALDILGAIIVYVYIMNVTTVMRLLQGIARGAFGRSAFNGGMAMALAGLGFHFIIAFSFTVFYFVIFPFIPFLGKQKIISGLLYGIFIWCIMNLIVLPLLHVAPVPTKWDSIVRSAGILMACVGIPVSLIISRHYRSNAIKMPRKELQPPPGNQRGF